MPSGNRAHAFTLGKFQDVGNFQNLTQTSGEGERAKVSNSLGLSLLALRLAVREIGLPPPPILYQNPRLVPRIVY